MDAAAFWKQVSDPAQPPLLLPDVGTFFNRDLQGGERLIRQVMAAGITCVKGEVLHDPDICLKSDAQERYLDAAGQPVSENYRQLIERKVLSLDDYRTLFRPVTNAGLGLALSVYDKAGTDFAIDIGACALKIASTNVVHAPLIRHAAASGLPLIIDTGKAGFNEAMRAVAWARDAGAERLVLEYSPPAPPAPTSQHNLRVLEKLARHFPGPLGLSDHHAGPEMLYAATALGCRILEKGVCPDELSAEQDAFHALPVGRLAETLRICNTIHEGLGNADDAYPPQPVRHAARMGLVAARDIAAGERLVEDAVGFAFPTLGIPVEDWDRVIDRTALKDISAGTPLEWSHVAPQPA